MRPPGRAVAAVAVLGWLLSVLAAPGSGAADATRNGRIAFSREGDVYTVRPDGSGLRRITDPAGFDAPLWSPGGARLAVVRSNPDGTASWVVVLRPDGTRPRRVTGRVQGSVQQLTWSPDGRRLAFADMDTANSDLPSPYPSAIVVVAADGSGQRRVTGYAGWNSGPTWSPDGRRLAFTSSRDGDGEIYVVRRDGSGLRRLTDDADDQWQPAWSPDGDAIAFTTARRGPESSTTWVSLVAADGSNRRDLVDEAVDYRSVEWSPDGSRLLLHGYTDGGRGSVLAVTGPALGPVRVLAQGAGLQSPSWSPDGRHVVFVRGERIVVVPAAGGAERRLVRGRVPDWRPLTG